MKHVRRALPCALLLSALAGRPILAQDPSGADTLATVRSVTVVAGARYEAGWLHRVLFGDHWRDAWTTPVEAELLDVETFAGGLTPIKRGGGFQTKSLRFQGADGRKYKFRSLDKDPTKVLPKELQESIAADVVQDQISSSNPFAPFVVAPLLNAVGVLNAAPRIVLLPDSAALGEFGGEFGGLLGILEEHPDERDDGQPGFGGSDKVVGTIDLFKRLERRNDERPDARAYLTARLMDILLGDWDRHVDQWLWARVSEGGAEIWKPIPRDRDQAFARYDGWLPWIAEQAVTQIEGFGESYPKIADLTWSGRHIDRRVLVPLERDVWDSTARAVVAALSDAIIDDAVRRLPAPVYAAEGERLSRDLRARRDALPEAAADFYEDLARAVDVRGSKEDEIAIVERLDDSRVRVRLFACAGDLASAHPGDGAIAGVLGRQLYDRTFDAAETREIRLYMEDGADSVHVGGDVAGSILVRVIGGEGPDAVVDDSHVAGYALGVIPFISDAETATIVHDHGGSTRLALGRSACHDATRAREPKDDARFEPLVPDIGHDWRFGPWLTATSDLGLFVGGGPILYEHGFRADPYVWRMSLLAGYATGAKTFKAQFTGDFRDLVGRARLALVARASGLEVQNYFGGGNESVRDEELDEVDYYEVRQRQYAIEPRLALEVFEGAEASLGATVVHVRSVDEGERRLETELTPYGFGTTTLAGATIGLLIDTRDVAEHASKGIFLEVRGELYPAVIDADEAFAKVRGEARGYLTAGWPLSTTLAVRAIGETNLGGRYPYYESAFLGGTGSLRGFDSERFAGDAALAGGAELRVDLVRFRVLFPGTLGISGAIESGRVFLEGESSDRWHTTYGGGIYLTLVERAITASLSAMRSPERLGLYVSGGVAW